MLGLGCTVLHHSEVMVLLVMRRALFSLPTREICI